MKLLGRYIPQELACSFYDRNIEVKPAHNKQIENEAAFHFGKIQPIHCIANEKYLTLVLAVSNVTHTLESESVPAGIQKRYPTRTPH